MYCIEFVIWISRKSTKDLLLLFSFALKNINKLSIKCIQILYPTLHPLFIITENQPKQFLCLTSKTSKYNF